MKQISPLIYTFGIVFSHAYTSAVMANDSSRHVFDSTMDACLYDASKPAEINVKFVEPSYEHSGAINTEFTLSEIRQLSKKNNPKLASTVVAFADVKFALGYEFSTRYFKLTDQHQECHYIDSITFILKFESPPSILFPKELYEDRHLDGGVCYDQIMAHEKQHVFDYEYVFEETIVKIHQDNRFAAGQILPNRNQMLSVAAADSHRATDIINTIVDDYYRDIINTTIKEISDDVQYRGNLLDSTEEYRRITELCADMDAYIR